MELGDEFCCLCLSIPEASKSEILSAVYDVKQGLSYGECIKIFTNIEFDKKYYLCEFCKLELETSYGFYKKVIRSYGILKDLENKVVVDNAKNDIPLEPLKDQEEANEIIEFEALESEYDFEDNTNYEDRLNFEALESDEHDLISFPKDVQITAESENFEDKIIEDETTLESSQIVENYDLSTISTDEMLFQQIEITPAEASILHDEVTPNPTKQNTDTQKQRKRFVGKFCCDYCDKMFPNHSRMIVHRRSHEPDRPKFACNECGRIYSTNQALDVHIRGVHKMSGYTCKICAKVFSSQASLTVHMRFHTGNFPYVCETCGHKFAQLCHLDTHRKVKHNSLRFCCVHPNCGKFFTSTASLRNHEFSHGIMPFECEFCHRGYPAKSKLKVHVRKVHKKDLTLDELEPMRKFHVMRSKPYVIQVEMSSVMENTSSKE